MIQKLNKQINNINEALSWIKEHKPEHYEQRSIQLVNERRKLRKLLFAESENPAIAAFGESQKGKSYLMGNLLQKNGVPFMVKIDGGRDEVDFVQSVNPIGDKKEATGVVTRFTAFKSRQQRYNADLPVIVKLLSPANIAAILCGGYYRNIIDYQTYSDQEIRLFAKQLYDKYAGVRDAAQEVFTADDVLEIKHYLSKYVTQVQSLTRSNYFETLALIIEKVPASEWIDALKFLWHENAIVSGLFNRMIGLLQKLNFSKEIYTDIETVRHYGNNTNTIMSVDCLNGLDDPNWAKTAVVYIKSGLQFSPVADISKCELAAVCAETIFKVEENYTVDMIDYKFYPGDKPGDMPQETVNKLHSTSIKKELLNNSDLLDFPGARNDLNLREAFLDRKDDTGTSNAVQMLLRGKVTYLFNSYSESRIVNALLYCHDAEAIVVNAMYITVNDWVEKYVGRTAEERKKTIQSCGGIPPLFNICTKFNIDMVEDEHPEKNNTAALNQRWSGRLIKVLYTQAFKANDIDWFKNWDGPGKTFKNSYLLRDFKYSGCSGSGNNLFEGYKDTDATPEEKSMKLSPDFYQRMRQTFISNNDVKTFFEDPALSWDVAATRNNDGALYIIDKMTVVAENMAVAREEQFEQQLNEVSSFLKDVMKEYHVSEDADEMLQENIRKANSIIREMDFTCNEDNYFFGHLLQALQVTESDCLQEIHRLIQSGELGEKNNNFKDYELILHRCRNFNGCSDIEACWQRLMMLYGMRDKEEAKQYLAIRQVDPQLLFSRNFKKKVNSVLIADTVFDLWQKDINSAEFMNRILDGQRFDSLVMSTLINDIIATANYLKLNELMADAIAEYVNVITVSTINESLVADILSSAINQFIIDLGYSRLSDKDRANARKVTDQYGLAIFDYIGKEHKSFFTEEELTVLFDELTDNPKAMTASFEDNYYTWMEYMCVSFIAHLDVPDYDKEANRQLSEIINNIS